MVLTSREPRRPECANQTRLVFPVMLFAALLLIPKVSVPASSYAPATLQDDPETIRFQEEELEYIRQDLDVLADSLKTALQSIELGSGLLDDIRKPFIIIIECILLGLFS